MVFCISELKRVITLLTSGNSAVVLRRTGNTYCVRKVVLLSVEVRPRSHPKWPRS